MRLVVPARAVSFFGDSLAFVVLSLRIAESDEPARMTSFFIAFSLPLFLLAGVAGRIVDEHDSRTLLVAAGCLQVVASVGLVLAPNFVALLAGVMVLQVGQAVTGPAWGAVVPRIVGDAAVGRVVGVQQTLSALAGMAGAAAGGVLYDVLGYGATLLLDTATFGVLVLVGAVVRTRRGRRYDAVWGTTASKEAAHADARLGGRRYIFDDALLRVLVPAMWLFILSAEATNVVEVFLITGDLGASAGMYGATMAAFMLGQIAGPLLAGRVVTDVRRIRWTSLSAATIGAAIVAVGLSPTIWVAIGMMTVAGVAGGALNALLSTLLLTRPPEHLRGRVLAAITRTPRWFSVIAMVLGGMAGQYVGARTTFVVCGLVSVAVSVVVLRGRTAVGEEPVSTSEVLGSTAS
ncbi:MAG: MFS transporter [Nocardioidaceae bacterium]